MSTKKGKFVSLEGLEGVGKTSNLLFIKELLLEQGVHVVVTREPGGTQLAEKIRQLLLDKNNEAFSEQTELLLMFASRSQHVSQVISPALDQGYWVLSDRFTLSSYAYQGGGRQMGTQNIAWLENFVQGDLRPNLTLLLDAPVEIGMGRARNRGALDRIEEESMAFFQRARDGYLEQARANPDVIKVIDASQELKRVQEQIRVHLDILMHDQNMETEARFL